MTAWRVCAGGPLAERALAVGVRRGVLEVLVEDARWVETVADLLPSLGAKIAERCPDLGIRSCRLLGPGGARRTLSAGSRAAGSAAAHHRP